MAGTLRPPLHDPLLVSDRGIPLVVGTVPSIEGDVHVLGCRPVSTTVLTVKRCVVVWMTLKRERFASTYRWRHSTRALRPLVLRGVCSPWRSSLRSTVLTLCVALRIVSRPKDLRPLDA